MKREFKVGDKAWEPRRGVRVLVRDKENMPWSAMVYYGESGSSVYPFSTMHSEGVNWRFCIPFEGNELLWNTTNDPA
jgi:hypothetical protein